MPRYSYPTPDQRVPALGVSPLAPDPRAAARALPVLADFIDKKVLVPLQNATEGKMNCVGDVTLDANSATTTLSDRRIGPESYIGFMPTTANAAAEIDTLYVTARGDGSCTLNHTNNAQTDRTFTYVVIG